MKTERAPSVIEHSRNLTDLDSGLATMPVNSKELLRELKVRFSPCPPTPADAIPHPPPRV